MLDFERDAVTEKGTSVQREKRPYERESRLGPEAPFCGFARLDQGEGGNRSMSRAAESQIEKNKGTDGSRWERDLPKGEAPQCAEGGIT